MKILHVISSMDPMRGGVCEAVRTIAFSLNNVSIENEVVCLDSADASFLVNDPIKIHALGTGKGPWSYNSKLLPWLKKNICRFDVVITHGLWQFHSFGLLKAIRSVRKATHLSKEDNIPKYFVMPHGMLDPYFQSAKGRRLKAIRNWLYWKIIEKAVINEADGILFTCKEEQRLAMQPFSPYSPKKELVVGLGVKRPPFFCSNMKKAFLEKCPEVTNSPYIIFLGRIHEKKGIDLLINAYSKLFISKKFQEKLPKLVIAGPGGQTPYGEKILQSVRQTEGLSNSIYFPGMLEGDAKWGAFYGCECFILPSHQENFGIAVVEALACGKPVLISNQVNIFKEIEYNGAGIVRDDTTTGTLQMLEYWTALSTPEKKNMTSQATTTYEAIFSIEAVTEKLVEAIIS
jgi:glycosyltransferase involved in cell wall biosynthesis